MTLKINRVSDFLKDQKCTKFGENPLKDVDSRVTFCISYLLYVHNNVTITVFLFLKDAHREENFQILTGCYRLKIRSFDLDL
jgi:hypothetical protein